MEKHFVLEKIKIKHYFILTTRTWKLPKRWFWNTNSHQHRWLSSNSLKYPRNLLQCFQLGQLRKSEITVYRQNILHLRNKIQLANKQLYKAKFLYERHKNYVFENYDIGEQALICSLKETTALLQEIFRNKVDNFLGHGQNFLLCKSLAYLLYCIIILFCLHNQV